MVLGSIVDSAINNYRPNSSGDDNQGVFRGRSGGLLDIMHGRVHMTIDSGEREAL